MLTGPPPKFHGTRDILGAASFGFAIRAKSSATHDFCNVFPSSGWFVDPGKNWTPQADSQEMQAALETYKKLADLGPNPSTLDQTGIVSVVQSGQAAQTVLVASTLAQLLDPATSRVAGKLGFAEVPANSSGTKPTPVSGTWSLCIPTGLAKDRATAALDFMKFASSATGQKQLLNSGNGGGVPVRDDVLNGSDVPELARPWLPLYKESLADVMPLPRFSFGSAFTQVTDKALSEVLGGQVSLSAGMSEMQSGLKGVVKAAGL